jgi:predicted PurR-regulated permease PerM
MLRSMTLENATFVSLLLVASLAFVFVVQDFLQPVFWAALLASLFYPVQIRLLARLGDRNGLCALIVLALIVLIVIVPLALVGGAVTRESAALYQRVLSGEVDLRAPLTWAQEMLPSAYEKLEEFGVQPEKVTAWISSAAATTSRFAAAGALSIGQNALILAVQFFLMLYLLFFFLRDGARLVERLVHMIPIGDVRERRLLAKFAEVSRATLKGTVVVGIIQGTLGGITFALLDIRAAVFWGVVMTVLSILPAVGASIVWIPTAIWLFATGDVTSGVILVLVGVFVIGLIDNLLRPILVGRDTKMPDYLILLSTLGGITAFGLSGFVIGPILAALCLAGWEMFAEDFGEPPPADQAPTSSA